MSYKLKRPKEGYSTQKERDYSKWSEVSEWELFYKNKRIGFIYYVGTALYKWAGCLEGHFHPKVCENTRRDVFNELVNLHKSKDKPVIIGRNDGCLICDDLGYICEDCFDDEHV
jgi:hypothetical protein